MTGTEAITKFQNMVDDVIGTDFALELLNDAKDEVEASRTWEVLKAQSSISVTNGSPYTTTYNLPSDFTYPLSLYDSGYLEYGQIAYEDQRLRRDQPYAFIVNGISTLQIMGTRNLSETFTLFYQKFSVDIASGTSWSNFPARWHKILPLKMAEIYYASDSGEKGRSWDDRWSNQFQRILSRMIQWDTKLTMKARRGSRGSTYNPRAITSYK